MAGAPKIDKNRAVVLRAQGWTLERIAQQFGVSRAAVSLSLSRTTSRMNMARREVLCLCGCGVLVRAPKKFASTACYMQHVSGDPSAYVKWRGGNKKARKVVAGVFALEHQQVVHHVDRDNRNNQIANLWVFASHSDHMSFHRGGDALPIWCGSGTTPEAAVLSARMHRLARRVDAL